MPRGKDAEWTPEQKAQAQNYICEQIALGRSLVKICQETEMPSYSTVTQWRGEDADFAAKYARAREDQADFHADAIVDIADTETDAAKARNRIDARKWHASKLKPKTYGDKLDVGGNLNLGLDDEQIKSRLAVLYGKAGIALASGGSGTQEGEA